MPIYHSVTELIGRTPLLELCNYERNHDLKAVLLAKLECMNPAGSAKDRVAANMIARAETEGRLAPGGTIIEPTSGNTGIGLAAAAAAKGYRVILTMPDTMSVERRALIAAYGAEIILTPGAAGMAGAVAKAEELHQSIPGSIIAGQFENPANPAAHEKTTGPEIWADTEGKVDIFVAGVGTGGTVSGVGRYLKAQDPAVRVVAFEPASSPPLPKFPAVTRDIAVVCDRAVTVGALEDCIRRGAKGLLKDVSLFDIYTGSGIPEGKKSVAFNLTLRSDDRSLTAQEADEDVKSILETLKAELNAVLR